MPRPTLRALPDARQMPDKRPLPARLYERGTVRGTLPMALAHLLARHLASRGVDPASILPLLPASPGDAVLGRCAAEDFCRWLLQAAEVLDDPLLGLHVGQSIDPVHLGPLGYALLNCENLGAALGQMLRYHRLLFDLNPVEPQLADGVLSLRWEATHGKVGALFNEMGLAAIVQCARAITGRALSPGRVDFIDPRPSDVRPYRAFFGCPVHFGQPVTRLDFPVTVLDIALKRPDATLRSLMEAQADAALDSLADANEPGELAHKVERVIGHLTADGMPALADVAARLRLSPRVLHKRLLARGAHFRDLREQVLRRQAEAHLARPELSIAQVAQLLGYSEQSAFTRAFKRWAGVTPLQWRRGC